jgi:phosphoesterase RecJ-like protein
MVYHEICRIINEEDNFAIISHVSPDGDSIGSVLGLYSALKERRKHTKVFIDDKLPEKYSFLPGYDEISSNDEEFKDCEFIFILDCGDEERCGKYKKLLNIGKTVINIDHHISNNSFGNLNYIEPEASSVGGDNV